MNSVDEARLTLALRLSTAPITVTITSDLDGITAAFRAWLDAVSDCCVKPGQGGHTALFDEAMALLTLHDAIDHVLNEAMLPLGVHAHTAPAEERGGL